MVWLPDYQGSDPMFSFWFFTKCCPYEVEKVKDSSAALVVVKLTIPRWLFLLYENQPTVPWRAWGLLHYFVVYDAFREWRFGLCHFLWGLRHFLAITTTERWSERQEGLDLSTIWKLGSWKERHYILRALCRPGEVLRLYKCYAGEIWHHSSDSSKNTDPEHARFPAMHAKSPPSTSNNHETACWEQPEYIKSNSVSQYWWKR